MFGKSIRFYRLQMGLSQESLAEMIGVQKMAISNYEKDKRTPNAETIEKICQALKIPVAKLLGFQDGPVSISNGSFRKDDNLSAMQRDAIITQVEDAANRYLAAASFAGAGPAECRLSAAPVPLPASSGEAALYLRSILGLPPSGPIENLLRVAENAGIVLVPVDTDTHSFSGFSSRCDGILSLIAYNRRMTPERQRFTMAHELVHLVFIVPGSSKDVENEVDNIAGRFLLPGIDIKCRLGQKRQNVEKTELQAIHDEYGVSGQCVAIRALQEGIISKAEYNHIANDSIVSTAHVETPNLLSNVVRRAFCMREISISKAAELLRISVAEARELFDVGVAAEW